jgi:peptidoglycan hydrolase FlgJ
MVAPPSIPSSPAIAPGAAVQKLASSREKARATAEDFEAVFLSSMFQQMFTDVDGDGPLGGGSGAGMWRSFLTDQYARSFAKSGGIGIADQVYRTLIAHQEAR